MRLSELKTGEKGVIVKVMGHGGFRKRIVEMGFIKGKTVEVVLNAPLKDPIKYKLLGYEISLRRQEAEMIEIVSEEEVLPTDEAQLEELTMPCDINPSSTPYPSNLSNKVRYTLFCFPSREGLGVCTSQFPNHFFKKSISLFIIFLLFFRFIVPQI